MNTSQAAMELALARYAVISPLVSRNWTKTEHYLEVRRILETRHHFPNDDKKRVSERSLRRWVAWYKEGRSLGVHTIPPGIDALKPVLRSDTGVPRVVDPATIERAVQLRTEEPLRTTRMVIEVLQAEAKGRGETLDIEEATLDFHLRARQMTRKALKKDGQVYPRYEHAHRNDCWQGDMTGSFFLPHPQNPKKSRQCYLHAFIDDKTRKAYGEFYFRQNFPCLSDCFRKAILHNGLPSQTYWDNGPAYQSKQIQLMAARLGIRVVFATPYRPQGKGKIERWFGHVKSSFYPDAHRANVQTIEELNQLFSGWLDQYNNRVHSELGMSPNDRWAAEEAETPLRWPDPATLIEAFLWEEERGVDKTGCVHLAGNSYPVAEHLASQKVSVRFDPFDMSKIRVYHKGVFVEAAQPQQLVSHTHRKALPRRVEKPVPLESSKRWRDQVSGDFRQKAMASMERGAAGPARQHEGLTRAEFAALIPEVLNGRSLTSQETTLVVDFYLRYSPLIRTLVRSALLAAIEAKGTRLHLRFYLEAIRTARNSETGGR
jgi:putative transposase